MNKLAKQLRITEIFHSLQGESTSIGLPTVFVRLTGCPLRCQYCDTAYAFNGGQIMALDEILLQIASYHCRYVCVTGGEPLAQPGCFALLTELCNRGYLVSLETSGARDISSVDKRVMIVMDLKTPHSGECDRNRLENLACLKKTDQIKFVICNRQDYDWACAMIAEHHLEKIAHILFSPSWGQLEAPLLADWIVQDNLPVRFQLQLHKILWKDTPGR
ncbi:7-carboxy-7-deazaguanine synthase QueE [Legionella londiniensis]|uniref:7-carboxy-7-deazaguanine synthase n=1 Tax=Legionella londiniensis TaxID=45068 RepID=A0A0W0VP67_9GAMM|nr:7-carboxy-7-deazaguanine synthase QueE [Legionella londiniensis]KTD21968.1 radical activating enzyme [Legionella londiniensis]STX94010.1 Organic radical activating enzyme [Legionella londiniensis]